MDNFYLDNMYSLRVNYEHDAVLNTKGNASIAVILLCSKSALFNRHIM